MEANTDTKPYREWLIENVKLELSLLLKWQIWSSIILAAFMQFAHNTAHNYVYYLASEYKVYGGPNGRLVDLGFIALANAANLRFVPNISLYCLGAASIAWATSIFFTRKIITNPNIHALQLLWRAAMVTTFTIILRSISFFVTILPAPAGHCAEDRFNPPDTTGEIFKRFDTGGGCSDLIFSSHMMYGLIAALVITHYTPLGMRGYPPSRLEVYSKYTFVVLIWGLALFEAIAIVRQQSHYSIDVFTALYAVPMTWITFHYFVPTDPQPAHLAKTDPQNTSV